MSRSVGPGPGHYGLPSTFGYEHHDPRKDRKPMFSMRGRYAINIDSVGPGPAGAYEISKLTQHGRPHNQEHTLRMRLQQPKQDAIPGPNAYFGNIQVLRPKAPSYSMRPRTIYPCDNC